MGSPRPSYGRAGNYGTQGRIEYGCSGGLGVWPNYVNSYNHVSPKRETMYIRYTYEGVRHHDLTCNILLYSGRGVTPNPKHNPNFKS